MNEKLNKIYQYLGTQNIKNLPSSYDDFEVMMQDSEKASKIHSFLLSNKIKNVDEDFNTFSEFVGLKKKEQTIPNLLEGVLQGQKHLSEVGNKVVETPSSESGTRPRQSPLTEEQPKEQTTPFGDVLRSLKSGSLRALGGVTASPSFLNRTLTGFAVRPMVKAMGGTDEDANLALDVIINTTPYGGATIGGAEAQKKLNKKAQQVEEKMRAIEGTIWDNIQQGKLADAGELLGRGFMQSLPYLAMTAATAGGGNVAVLTTLGATSASQQYAELEGKKESRRLLNSWLYGGFEAAGELVTAGLTRGIARSFRGTGKPPDPNFIKGLAKEVAKGFGLEGSSEAMTQIGQNLTDVVTGIDENRNILDGVLDALLIGGVTGAGLGVLNPTASVVGRTIASDKETKQVQDNVVQQETLINQIEQTDSDRVKNALKKSVKDLQVQVDEITDKNYQVAQKMTPEQQQQVGELYSVWNQLQDKIDNNEISETEKPAIENTIKGIKDQIQTVKDDLIKAEEERVKAEKEAKVEATKEALKNELDKIAKQKEKALDKVKDVKEGEKVNKKEVESVKKEFEDRVDEAKAKSDEELTKIEEESKDAEGIRGEVKEGVSTETPKLEQGTESGLPVGDTSQDGVEAVKGEKVKTGIPITKKLFRATHDVVREENEEGIFYTTDKGVAESYLTKGKTIKEENVTLNNPMVVDAEGKDWQELIGDKDRLELLAEAKAKGHDGLIIKNQVDVGGMNDVTRASDIFIKFTPAKVQETLPKTEQEGEVTVPTEKTEPQTKILSEDNPNVVSESDFNYEYEKINKPPKKPQINEFGGQKGAYRPVDENRLKGVNTTYHNKLKKWQEIRDAEYRKKIQSIIDEKPSLSFYQIESFANFLNRIGENKTATDFIKEYGYTQKINGKWDRPKESIQKEVVSTEREQRSIIEQKTDLLGDEKEEAMIPVTYEKNPIYQVNDDVYIKTDYGQTRGSRNIYSVRGRNDNGDYILWGKSNGANIVVSPDVIERGIKQKRTTKAGSIDAIDYAQGEGLYQQWVKEGRMTATDAKTIMESANIFVPKEIQELSLQEQNKPPLKSKELKDKESEIKAKIAQNLEDLAGAIGAIKQFTGEERANVLKIITDLINNLADLTSLKGQQLYERLKEELKAWSIPEDVVKEAWDKSGFAEDEATTYTNEAKQKEIIQKFTHYKSGDNYYPRTIWADWFLGRDRKSKERIAKEIRDNDELKNALQSSLYDEYIKQTGNKDLSYNDFLNTEINVYRGETQGDVKGGEPYGFQTYTLTEQEARNFTETGKIIKTKIKPKDTYGLIQSVGAEREIIVPTRFSDKFYEKEFNDLADKNMSIIEKLPKEQSNKLFDLVDKNKYKEAYDELNRLIAPPEVKGKPKETLKQESDSGLPTGEKVAEKAPPKRKEPKEREKAYLNRVFKAEAPTDRLKALIEKKGLNYKQIPNHVSKEEADFLISQKGIEKMWDDVRDLNNGMPGAVRASILARLTFHYDQLGQEAEKEGNLAEAEMYYDKALAVVVFTDLDARDAGRFTQYLGSDEVTMMLSPKRNVERVKRALRKQRDDKMTDRQPEVDDKAKKMRKANEESIDEVVKSKKIKEVVDKIIKKEKTEPGKRRVPQERIKAEQDFRKKQYEILANAWKAKRDAEKSGSMGFSAIAYDEVIADTLGKIFRSYVKQGYYNVEDILIKVQKEFKKLVDEEVDTKTLRKYIPKDIDGKSFDDSLEENLLDNAKDKLAGRIVKMLEDKKVPKNDPIKQMIDTLFGKVKEGDTKEKEKKEGKPAIDKIKEALDNKEEYAEVWEKAKEEVQTRIDYNNELSEEQKAEYTKRLDAFYKEIIGKPYTQKQVEQITRQAIEDLGFAMDRIIREHYTIQDVISISLQEKLVEELGLTGEDAKLLADAVDKEFRKIATARKLSVLRRGMKPRDVNNPKQSRQEWQRLIELTNMGAFSDAEFAEAYADAWGFPKLTPEQAKELERLAGKVYEIKTGFKQYEAVQDYLNYIARIPGVDMGEVIMGVWYANILSGARTQSKNFLGNTANFLAEWSVSVVKAAATGKFDVIPFVTIGAGRGLKQGLYDFWYTMTTGYSPIRGGKIEAATTLERWRFKGWKYPLNAFKYVGRFMIATDTLFYSGLKEFRAYEMAMMEARKSDPEATEPSQSNWAKANEILHNTTERRIEAESQATEEGLKGIEWKKRVWEIMEESRGETIVHGSADFASRGTYNYKPEGMLGAATAMIARLADWATIKPTLFGKQYSIRVGKLIVPFTRIIANVGNTAMDYTPIGYIRWAQGSMGLEYFKNEDQAKSFYRKLTSEERWRIFTKASLGLAAYTLLLAKSAPGDDDEEPELTITADGFGDFAKNEELKKQPEGWQQYSVKIKGKWYSYQYTPLFLVLAPLGWLRDGQKYKKDKFDEKSTLDLIGGSMFRTMAAMADMTWMTTVAGFLESFTTGTPEGYFKRLGTSTVKGLIYPKFVEQFKQYYDEWNDNPKKYSSSFWGKILKDTPLLTNKFPVQYNNFGEPVIFDPVQMIESGTSDPYAKYIAENLYQHGKVLGVPSQKETACTIYDEDKKIERQMDDFEYMDYVREIGLRTKDRIMTELMPKDLTWEEIGKEVESIKQEVRQLVKAEMFGWGEFRMANPLKWKTLYNNRAVQIPETTPVKWKDEDGKQMKATKEEMVQFNKDAMNIYTEYMLEYLAGKPDKKEINPATGEFIYIEYIKTLWSGSKEAAKAQLIENREISPK